jgi:hypothetical protein
MNLLVVVQRTSDTKLRRRPKVGVQIATLLYWISIIHVASTTIKGLRMKNAMLAMLMAPFAVILLFAIVFTMTLAVGVGINTLNDIMDDGPKPPPAFEEPIVWTFLPYSNLELLEFDVPSA